MNLSQENIPEEEDWESSFGNAVSWEAMALTGELLERRE